MVSSFRPLAAEEVGYKAKGTVLSYNPFVSFFVRRVPELLYFRSSFNLSSRRVRLCNGGIGLCNFFDSSAITNLSASRIASGALLRLITTRCEKNSCNSYEQEC